MRIDLKTLLSELGVAKQLQAYETYPWLHYDDDEELTCAAEVRVAPSSSKIEAELQLLYDDPAKHGRNSNDPHQIILLLVIPVKNGEWQVEKLWIKGEEMTNQIGGWDRKGCALFKACVQALQMGELPDIETLIKSILKGDQAAGGNGRIGRKAPSADTSAMLGIKQKP